MSKILLAEDDPNISLLYQRVLSKKGHTIFPAHDGTEVLTQVAQKPDLILLDILMPKMNGLETLDRLKANPLTQNIPVIMLTNLSGDESTKLALGKGAIDYLVKSQFTPQQIADAVQNHLKRRG